MFITGDEKIKTRGKRRQFDSVTDTGTEREKAQGYIDRMGNVHDVMFCLQEKDAASSGKAGGKHGKSVAGLKVKGMSGKKGKK